MSAPSNLPQALAGAKAPLLSAEAFADLQRRALLKGLRLTRSESNGETRVWVNGHEILHLEDVEAVIVHAASPWDRPLAAAKAPPAPAPSPRQLEDEARLRDARLELESARIAGDIAGMVAGAQTGNKLLESMDTLVAAEKVHGVAEVRATVHAASLIKRAKRNT